MFSLPLSYARSVCSTKKRQRGLIRSGGLLLMRTALPKVCLVSDIDSSTRVRTGFLSPTSPLLLQTAMALKKSKAAPSPALGHGAITQAPAPEAAVAHVPSPPCSLQRWPKRTTSFRMPFPRNPQPQSRAQPPLLPLSR